MYEAFVCVIRTRPHFDPKYTKIQIGNIYNSDVIVDLSIQNGDLGIYFPPDGQLSEEFCISNKLLRKHPISGEEMGGYLESNRRVKAIKICGIESMGLWMPLSCLSGDVSALKDGDKLTKFNGVEICKKYITEATARAAHKLKGKKGKINQTFFPIHYDTAQWKFCQNIPQKDSVVFISEKLHGTSGRTGKVLVEMPKKLSFWQRIAKNLGFKVNSTELIYQIVNGSRKVNLGTLERQLSCYDKEEEGFYGSNSFRWEAIKSWAYGLRSGEVIYYELVGFVGAKPIQKSGAPENKKLIKKYGKSSMIFSYGCSVGEFKVYVYRITMTDQIQKTEFDLSWTEIQKRCLELGLKHVPELDRFIYDGDLDKLEERIQLHVQGDSILDSRHLREGVCIRFEQDKGIKVVKSKSFDFFVLEGMAKSNEEYVDSEEMEE